MIKNPGCQRGQSQRDCVLQPRVASLRATLGNRAAGVSTPTGLWPRYPADAAENNTLFHPNFARRNLSPVERHPNPYRMLRRKLMDDASGKYFVGQLTS